MLKVIIGVSAIALAAGAAQAQNASDVYQEGEANVAFIDQSGADTANASSSVRQVGDNNGVDVLQAGSNNRSDIAQEDLYDTGMEGDVTIAAGNIAVVTQLSTAVGTYSLIEQDGVGNEAHATLGGEGSGGTGPGGHGTPESFISQVGDGNFADVTSNGNFTQSTVLQGYFVDAPAGSEADPFLATVTVANNNLVTVEQTALAENARSTIYQGSSDNNAEVTQDAADVFSEIRQFGEGSHEALVTQSADTAVSYILQEGFGNSATVNQISAGAVGASSNIHQTGAFNTVSVTQ